MSNLGERLRIVERAARGTLYVASSTPRVDSGSTVPRTGIGGHPVDGKTKFTPEYRKYIYKSWLSNTGHEIRVSPDLDAAERQRYLDAAAAVLSYNYATIFEINAREKICLF